MVGDIDRGGVFAALYATLALLESFDQALVEGWIVKEGPCGGRGSGSNSLSRTLDGVSPMGRTGLPARLRGDGAGCDPRDRAAFRHQPS